MKKKDDEDFESRCERDELNSRDDALGGSALGLLNEVRRHKIACDTITYDAAISACEKGRQWETSQRSVHARRGSSGKVCPYHFMFLLYTPMELAHVIHSVCFFAGPKDLCGSF